VLIRPNTGSPEETVWSEASVDVKERLLELLTTPLAAPPHLAHLIERRQLWFRAAHAPSVRALKTAIDTQQQPAK
jgi:hypothetical protein